LKRSARAFARGQLDDGAGKALTLIGLQILDAGNEYLELILLLIALVAAAGAAHPLDLQLSHYAQDVILLYKAAVFGGGCECLKTKVEHPFRLTAIWFQTRFHSMIQSCTHDLPRSAEVAWRQRQEFAVMRSQIPAESMVRPPSS